MYMPWSAKIFQPWGPWLYSKPQVPSEFGALAGSCWEPKRPGIVLPQGQNQAKQRPQNFKGKKTKSKLTAKLIF